MSRVNLAKTPVVDLRKIAAHQVRVANLGGQEFDVELVLDRSGSMEDEYDSDLVQRVIERCFAACLALDPDGKMPVNLFHNRVVPAPELHAQNVDGYVKTQLRSVDYGGTEYAPPLVDIRKRRACKTSMFGSTPQPAARPVLVLFITDGDNSDKPATRTALKALSETAPVFVKFIGLDTGSNVRFATLEALDDMVGRKFDNADFFAWHGGLTDDQLYAAILNEAHKALAGMRSAGLLA